MDSYVSPSESKPWSVNEEIKQEAQGNHNFWIVCAILASLCVFVFCCCCCFSGSYIQYNVPSVS